MRYELEMARYAEERGFSEIWQADTRLARDCVVMMSALLASTSRLRIGSGVLPIYTRNPAVIAATWSTMWELGGLTPEGESRVMLGLGAWWEPIASRVGADRRKPLTAMRENIEAIRALFTMEEVSYDFEVLGQSEQDPDMADVLLVATRTENVEQRQAAVEAAGRTFLEVDPEALRLLTETAMHDIAHYLRPAHLAQLRGLLA